MISQAGSLNLCTTPVFKKLKQDPPMENVKPAKQTQNPRPRYYAVARRLSVLSPELVHKIFDDLPIGRILELSCLPDSHYVVECAISHYGISRILDKTQFDEIRAYFSVYANLCLERKGGGHNGYPDADSSTPSPLQRDAVWHLNRSYQARSAYDTILSYIKAKIHELMNNYQVYLPVLLQFDDSKIPHREGWKYLSSAEDTQILWQSLHSAETALNKRKADQIQRICGLLVQYPGMLRKVQNTVQDARLHAEHHQVQTFQRLADKMIKPQIGRQQFAGNDLFATHRFPVIPYDRHLRCFLKILKKYPSDNNLIYPPNIRADIKTVIDGMAYVHIRQNLVCNTPEPKLLRTKFTPYSPTGLKVALGQNQPQFVVGIDPPVPQRKRKDVLKGEDDWRISDLRDRILPLEEKEFEWLEAFLRCCKHMEGIQDAEWTAGVTIGQFWKEHAVLTPSFSLGDKAARVGPIT